MGDGSDGSADFVRAAGWGAAERRHLAGDASDRRYQRLSDGDTRAVLMVTPPDSADNPAAFVKIAAHLRGIGLSAPQVLAQDIDHGLLLLEDLGDNLYARCIADDPASELQLYEAATDVLIRLQAHPAPRALLDLSPQDWAEAAAFALRWYGFAATGRRPDESGFTAQLANLMTRYANGPRVLILRDYHAENLLWLPQRSGLARVGLLDFQLAQMGQPGYDLVSLLQDARRDVPAGVEDAMRTRFASDEAFAAAYAVLGAQRALRIVGICARLCLAGGKTHYVSLLPRVWSHLQRNLAHPVCDGLADICAGLLPAPTPEILARIEAQCGTHPKG